ncbi:hypothetical protein [Salinarimonas sp.]|uniref:hypothetical protein n=1 Tax=Salinarimonas sp. TaxID=2766526 RepID=UPI0032D8EE77
MIASLARLRALATAVLVLLAASAAPAGAAGLELVWIDRSGAEQARRTLSTDEAEALGAVEIATSTPWTQGVVRFSGPTLAALAALEGGEVVEARLQALNDYSIDVPAEDWAAYDVVLASRADGARMRVRDRGPFWLVYPLDSDPALQTQRYHARMIWQVRRIAFVVDGP